MIWVDADAAPTEVKEIIFRAAKRLEISTVLVANRAIMIPPALTMVKSVRVSEGADVADRYIVRHARRGDLAITADVPLASLLVQKELFVIDPRGEEYSQETIASRLSMRDFMDNLRGSGVVTGGSKPFANTDKQRFASTFDRLLTKAIKQSAKRN